MAYLQITWLQWLFLSGDLHGVADGTHCVHTYMSPLCFGEWFVLSVLRSVVLSLEFIYLL